MTEAIHYGGWGRRLSAIGIRATSFQFPQIRWDCVWFLFTVRERVVSVNRDVMIAPVVVAT